MGDKNTNKNGIISAVEQTLHIQSQQRETAHDKNR